MATADSVAVRCRPVGGVTGAEYALIGTVVGAGLTQIGPVVSAIAHSRTKRQKAAAKRNNQREVKRKPLYMDLIGQAGLTEDLLNQVTKAIDTNKPLPEHWYSRLEELLSRIDGRVTQIRIDGSDRAMAIVEKLDGRIIKSGLTDEELMDDASNYAVDAQNASKALRTAREALIRLAREEFGN